MSNRLLDGEMLGRLGGDEFLVVIDDQPESRAVELAEQLVDACTETLVIGNIHVRPKLSIGVASRDESTPSANYLLGTADHAMYAAKASDKSLMVADDAIGQQVALIMMLDRELDAAMANGDIEYHYQPVRDAITSEILAAEALLRWNHPVFGWISPPLIVERIEGTGRIGQFNDWTLRTAARDLAAVRRMVPRFADKAFAINLTPHQLARPSYADRHLAACTEFGLRAADLIIEVVECADIEPGDPAEDTLRAIAAAGGVIALDDFGAGHNGLRYFARFPIHAIKFDRSLVNATVSSPTARTILGTLATMCDELGIVALAEGVETEVEHKICVEAGIHHGQGWYFGRPMPLDNFIELAASELATSVRPSVTS